MTVRVLIDDQRSFADDRDAIVARDVASAIEVFLDNEHIDELWLDFVLAGSESVSDVLSELVQQKIPVSIDKVFIHSSAPGAYGLLAHHLRRLGVPLNNVTVVEAYLHF